MQQILRISYYFLASLTALTAVFFSSAQILNTGYYGYDVYGVYDGSGGYDASGGYADE